MDVPNVAASDVLCAEDTRFLEQIKAFPSLKSVIRVVAERTIKGKTTTERRYFISSAPSNAKTALYAIPSHWAIENVLHRTRGVAFHTLREYAKTMRRSVWLLCVI